MTYCNPNDDVTLYYSFSGDTQKRVMKFKGTIDVQTGIGSTSWTKTSNYSTQGYRLTFHSTIDDQGPSASRIVLDYSFTATGTNNPPYYINLLLCPDANPRRVTYKAVDTNVTIDTNSHCTTSDIGTCSIRVLQSGSVVFSDSGKCPVEYNVGCNGCPPGFCKCHSDSYPGYCCLDCEAIGARIDHITAMAKEKGNGR
jgi:hypothetical protein